MTYSDAIGPQQFSSLSLSLSLVSLGELNRIMIPVLVDNLVDSLVMQFKFPKLIFHAQFSPSLLTPGIVS